MSKWLPKTFVTILTVRIEELAAYLLSAEEMRRDVEEDEEDTTSTVTQPATPAAPSSLPPSQKTFVVFNGREVGLFNDW